MTTQHLNRETVYERTDALALAGQSEVISDKREVSAFIERLKHGGSSIPTHLIELAHNLTEEEYSHLQYEIPAIILQGIVTRAVLAGAAQVISDTGSSALEAKQLDELIDAANVTPPETQA
jgi:hypothetical protein